MADALIIGEVADGAASSSTLEGVAAARSLGADKVCVLLTGSDAAGAAQSAIAGGADAVYTVTDGAAADGELDALVDAAQAASAQCSPQYVIGAKTLVGRDVMPRLAFRLGTALASDCTAVALDDAGRLLATRPTYGGNAEATVACLSNPAVVSLRPKSIDALAPDASRTGRSCRLRWKPTCGRRCWSGWRRRLKASVWRMRASSYRADEASEGRSRSWRWRVLRAARWSGRRVARGV